MKVYACIHILYKQRAFYASLGSMNRREFFAAMAVCLSFNFGISMLTGYFFWITSPRPQTAYHFCTITASVCNLSVIN